MNKVMLVGRLTKDPSVRYSQGDTQTAVARFTLAVDRRFKRDGDEQTADFIGCVAFGKQAEFVEKYAHKGTKFNLVGRIQTGRFTNKDGQTVFTTDIVAEELEFAESKAAQGSAGVSDSGSGSQTERQAEVPQKADEGFMNVPGEIDEDLPFN